MAEDLTELIVDALRISQERSGRTTAKDTAALREIAAAIRMSAVFTARGTSAVYASVMKEVADLLAAGTIGEADARLTLLESLRALGYTPEGGFPDAPPGAVPPALRGTLQDLSSDRRLDLIVRTQTDLMAGAGQQYRGHTVERIQQFPAWQLIRVIPVEDARNWDARWQLAFGTEPVEGFPRNAIRILRARTGYCALKGHPGWGELGSSGNFPDALDVDHAPFYFNSGVGLRELSRREALEYGLRGPDGETIDEWFASQPVTLRGKLPVPAPKMSVKSLDRDLVEKLKTDTGATFKRGTLDLSDLMAKSIARREAARENQ
jgi:hypothetical protein